MTMFTDGAMVVYQLQYLRSRYAAPITARLYAARSEGGKRLAGRSCVRKPVGRSPSAGNDGA